MSRRQTKNPTTVAAGQGSIQNKAQTKHTNVPKKWQRVLSAFLTGRSYNRFEAERQLHDHALHSTVSTLQSMGVVIERKMECVPGFQGLATHVCRYKINPNSIEAAKSLLGVKEGDR